MAPRSRPGEHERAALDPDPRVGEARRALLEGVGAEVAASFPGITRLGGQVVAALWLSDAPCSMDELAAALGCAKSNVFANLRALEAAGIVEKRREAGARHDVYALRGAYPDVIIGAYLARLRRVVRDKQALVGRSRALLGDAAGAEADGLRARIDDLGRKYDVFAGLMERLMPPVDGPVDLERLFALVPERLVVAVEGAARAAFAVASFADAARRRRAKR